MEFINRSFPTVLKLIFLAIVMLVFVKVIPLLLVVILGFWAFNSGKKYFKKHKREKRSYKKQVYKEETDYSYNNFSKGKIIDVEYEEV